VAGPPTPGPRFEAVLVSVVVHPESGSLAEVIDAKQVLRRGGHLRRRSCRVIDGRLHAIGVQEAVCDVGGAIGVEADDDAGADLFHGGRHEEQQCRSNKQ
jgi:hypothetical protein